MASPPLLRVGFGNGFPMIAKVFPECCDVTPFQFAGKPWLVTHGFGRQADATVADIEQRVRADTGRELEHAEGRLEVHPRRTFGSGPYRVRTVSDTTRQNRARWHVEIEHGNDGHLTLRSPPGRPPEGPAKEPDHERLGAFGWCRWAQRVDSKM